MEARSTDAQNGASLSATELRRLGNQWYGHFKTGSSYDEKRKALNRAVELYENSVERAGRTDYDDKASAFKNIGVSYAALEKLETKRKAELYYMKHAAYARAKALAYGEAGKKPDKWLQEVAMDLEATVGLYIEKGQGLMEDTISDILQVVNVDVLSPVYHHMVCRHRIDQGERILNKCMQLVSDRDYKIALPALKGLYHPIEEAKRHAKNVEDLEREASILEGETESFTGIAEGLQSFGLGEETQQRILATDSVCRKSDLGFLALDYFKQTEVLARGEDVELVAMAQGKLGIILCQAFNFTDRAELCFKEAINLSMTVVGNVHTRAWYQEVTGFMQKMRDEREKRENARWENRRKPYIDQLKTELEQIWSMKERLTVDIIDFLWDKFPPKHTKNAVKPSKTLSNEKRLLKMNSMYHPDKVDEEEFGTKYKVLCEEITSMINSKYGSLKMGDDCFTKKK